MMNFLGASPVRHYEDPPTTKDDAMGAVQQGRPHRPLLVGGQVLPRVKVWAPGVPAPAGRDPPRPSEPHKAVADGSERHVGTRRSQVEAEQDGAP